jgi:hypothetical protein
MQRTSWVSTTNNGELAEGLVNIYYSERRVGGVSTIDYRRHTLWAKLGTDSTSIQFEALWTEAGMTDTLDLPINGTGEWGGSGTGRTKLKGFK